MNSTLTLEQRLASTLQSIGKDYDAASAVLSRIQAPEGGPAAADPRMLHELELVLANIAGRQRDMSAARQQWQSQQGRASPALRRVLDEQTQRLEQLLILVQRCEKGLVEAREQLRPELDSFSRREQMQRAYGGSRGGKQAHP